MNAIRRAGRAVLGSGHYDEVEVARKVLARSSGFMVDVGAHRGFACMPFIQDGWSVLGLEPDPVNRAFLEAAAHPRLTVDPRAVTDVDGDTLTLYTSEVSSGISTLTPFHESHHAGAEVQTVRLDTLLSSHSVTHVDLLKVDTEGHDLPVLRTFPWDSITPDVVVCEFEDRKTVPLGYTYRDLGDFLVSHGYVVLMSEWLPIIEYGTRHTWHRVVDYPGEVADEGGWGNFIAVRPEVAKRARRVASQMGRRVKVCRTIEKISGR